MSYQRYQVCIVGGGAAGLMLATLLSQSEIDVLLLEGSPRLGTKILMSGGTRCNITNREVDETVFFSESLKSVRNILRRFSSKDAIEYFQSMNLFLKEETDGKIFPVSDQAQSVLDAFINEIKKNHVSVRINQKVTSIQKKENDFIIKGNDFEYEVPIVILTTGGMSHPKTGSDGSGYQLAKYLGHSVLKTTPALTPFLTLDADWKQLSGLSVYCELQLWVNDQKKETHQGSFLWTHFGFSGPVVLNISRSWIRETSMNKKIVINFLPDLTIEHLRSNLIKDQSQNPKQKISNFLNQFFPKRLTQTFLKKIGVNEEISLNQLNKETRQKIIKNIFNYDLEVNDVYGFQKAEITAGGIPFNEVNTKTLESKLSSNLYFAGEIMDVDGLIGGYNFQWAWSSSYVCYQSIVKKLNCSGRH